MLSNECLGLRAVGIVDKWIFDYLEGGVGTSPYGETRSYYDGARIAEGTQSLITIKC